MSMKQQNAGYTIVELLVAILLTGILITSTSSLFISIQNLQRRSDYLDSATRAAQRQIEVLRNDDYASLTPGQTIDFSDDLPDSLPGNPTGTVVVSQPVNDLRRVDVTVSYGVGDSQRSVVLSSLIGTIGIAQ